MCEFALQKQLWQFRKESNNLKSPRRAFTILELLIIVIIISVLASLALPKFFSIIEATRATEALNGITMIKSSLERMYVMNNGSYMGACILDGFLTPNAQWDCLNVSNLDTLPNSHFRYSMWVSPSEYGIIAYRNSIDGGNESDYIHFWLDYDMYKKCGTGAFSRIGIETCP